MTRSDLFQGRAKLVGQVFSGQWEQLSAQGLIQG